MTVPGHHIFVGLSNILTDCPGYSGGRSIFGHFGHSRLSPSRSSSLFLMLSSLISCGCEGSTVAICLFISSSADDGNLEYTGVALILSSARLML